VRTRRIFWLGMHKVLKTTELRRLRHLGFEVFNPPYISPIYDQSADRRLDYDQFTTLPVEIFGRLMQHNFFYTDIPPSIAEILNAYFDVAIVTIRADWLKALLTAFKGPVVYRIYGQIFSLSEHILSINLQDTLISRDNFSIVPFAEESVDREHRWFLDLCSHFVPYQIPDDVFALSGSWSTRHHRREIATNIPNIENPYYEAAYADFVADYPQPFFRIYGPQRAVPIDPRIVGELDRTDFLNRLATSSGFFYNYRDNVCYLPPIEMMQIGGPVIYVPGSLLSRFYKERTPGLACDRAEAEKKLERLLRRDREFAEEVIAAQDPVRRRYDRDVISPIFDEAFKKLLGTGEPAPALGKRTGPYLCSRGAIVASCRATQSIVIPLHMDGLFVHVKGQAYAFQGIPRVVDVVVDALMEHSDVDVLISCTGASLPAVHDFFRSHFKSGRLTFYTITTDRTAVETDCERLRFIKAINRREDVLSVFVPHYYLFPECLLCTAPLTLYLPDYFPHLMPDHVFDISVEKDQENKRVGVAIAKKAKAILTNSEFTKSYLADAGFVTADEADKIVVAPLPILGAKRGRTLDQDDERELESRIGNRPFLFYPTANRPNKQIPFLLRLFANLQITRPDLGLVLTCDLGSFPPAAQAAHQYGLTDQIIFLHGLSEPALRRLYEKAAALCFTSTLEGNFPPQIVEALHYGTPIVATRLPTISEALASWCEDLLLCRPLDLRDFMDKTDFALKNRSKILARQKAVLNYLDTRNSMTHFFTELRRALLHSD
jgi:glycosyltransferase involved in cell wall biosynthesis